MEKQTTDVLIEELGVKLHALILMVEYMHTNGVAGSKIVFRSQFESFLADARRELAALKSMAERDG